MSIKIICFDLDNTICKTKKNYYKKSLPIKKNVKFINNLYEKGYYIKIFTARYMGRSKENKLLAEKKGLKLTKNQLKDWGLKYHEVIFGKPSYDIFIDDKALYFKKDWTSELTKVL
jgi:FMN phosphatase YigB (HAD superfamily)